MDVTRAIRSHDQAQRLLPRCDRCQRRVDSIREWYDQLRLVTVYTVFCHGASEELQIPDSTMLDIRGCLEAGVAFRQNRLPSGPKSLPEST